LIFFNTQAFAENVQGALEGDIQASITQQTGDLYDDFCQKIKPIGAGRTFEKDFTE